MLLSGGAILSPTVKHALVDRLPGVLVVDGYGASETGGQGQSVSVAGGEIAIGAPVPVSPTTRSCSATTCGPSPTASSGGSPGAGRIPLGYYKDPEKTAATFPVVDGVRWSVPGDHAVVDDDGMITLLGRGSVSINTGGEKVYPEEVEAGPEGARRGLRRGGRRRARRALAASASSRSCKPGPAPRRRSKNCRSTRGAHVAGYKIPRDLVVVDAIVRSPSGKPDYRWARAAAGDGLSA